MTDNIPEHKLYALRPLLDVLVDEEDTDDNILSDEERRLLEKCREDRKEHPEHFTPWRLVRHLLKS
ncbi:hypothetical protein FACS1894172_19950 [Spirochaetia bacterium]|nr:hypothetical protein FACS1894164_19930 [Spirochaetia bacterium]GHU36829.1 hypothetical protein FACS1894172_19950 [Spirochaetia bacterium]